MTLQYISRNPYLVRGVVEAIEKNYTGDFATVMSGVRSGVYAGELARTLAEKLPEEYKLFRGRLVRSKIRDYIAHLVRSGEPIFIHRTSLGAGTYCLTNENRPQDKPLPCITARSISEDTRPNPDNCQLECKNLIFLGMAKKALVQNVEFYSNILLSNPANQRMRAAISEKLAFAETRLAELEERGSTRRQAANISMRFV